jgi:ubiquinone biosynthesis protein
MPSVSLRRYGQIIDVLVKYGFSYYLNEIFPGFISSRKSAQDDYSSYSEYARVRMALEELGPTFVKFGQLMSTRTELFPAEMIAELSRLQDRVGAVPFDDVIPTLDEFIPDWRDVFASVDPVPLAAASISQVHRAVMQDGTVLALKIQRPNIQTRVAQDVILLRGLAERIEESRPDLRMYNPKSLVEDFAVQIRKELDFTRDGMNAERLRRNMRTAGIPGIKVPKIYWEFSGKRLLAMEFVTGVRSDNLEAIQMMGLDPRDLASRGLKAFMVQIFQNGFYHGDPHPGNLQISPKGELVFLDFGVCGVLLRDTRNRFIELMLALFSADTDMTIRSVRNLGVKIPSSGFEEFRGELYLVLEDSREMGALVNFSGLIESIQDLFQRNSIRVPENLMQLLKALMLVSAIAFRLDPGLEFAKEAEPYLRKIITEDAGNPENIHKKVLEAKARIDDLARVPKQLSAVLEMASEGKMRIDVRAQEVENLRVSIESSVDKLVIGLMMSAIVIGLSLILMMQPAEAGSYPLLAYAIAIGIIIVLFYRMYTRKGKKLND